MGFRNFVRGLRLRGWSIALITLVAVGLSLAFTLHQTPRYASTSRLFVTTSVDGSAGSPAKGDAALVRSYGDIVRGSTITRRVTTSLNLNETPRQLSEQIRTSADPSSPAILRITVRDPAPERARLLANALTKEFVAFVGEAADADNSPTARAIVVDTASTPSAPVSPNLPLNLGIGLGAGLLLGLLWAALRERADHTVRTASALEDATGAPLLGAILFDDEADDVPTIRDLDTYDPRMEAFRVVRTSLQHVNPGGDQPGDSKVYVVTSAVPGEGKTTTAINLALILAEGGENVALVEADLRRPTMSKYLDLDPAIGLTTTLIGRTTLNDALQEVGAVDVLTSGRRPPNPAELVKSEPMRQLIEQLRRTNSYILIDAPPLLPVTDASLLAAASDGVILVTRHGDTTDVELATAVSRIKSVNGTIVGSIFTMASASDADGYGYGYGYAPDDVEPETAVTGD